MIQITLQAIFKHGLKKYIKYDTLVPGCSKEEHWTQLMIFW